MPHKTIYVFRVVHRGGCGYDIDCRDGKYTSLEGVAAAIVGLLEERVEAGSKGKLVISFSAPEGLTISPASVFLPPLCFPLSESEQTELYLRLNKMFEQWREERDSESG